MRAILATECEKPVKEHALQTTAGEPDVPVAEPDLDLDDADDTPQPTEAERKKKKRNEALFPWRRMILLSEDMPLPYRIPLAYQLEWRVDRVLGSVSDLRIERLTEVQNNPDKVPDWAHGLLCLTGELHFSENEHGVRVRKDVEAGHVMFMSVGYTSLASMKIKAGSRHDQGRGFLHGPLIVDTNIQLIEVTPTINPLDRFCRILHVPEKTSKEAHV